MNEFTYVADKETKGTFRFAPNVAAEDYLGQATIYIKKEALEDMGIKNIQVGKTEIKVSIKL
jgi:hypothetical protein